MFWRMTGLSTASPVEAILDKEKFTLEELLDEDEIVQECKALNGRLINYFREKSSIKQLIQYIVEEPPEDAERQRTFKFPFVACEIFTCEVDIILKALVEDDELMGLLFSFLDPGRVHSTVLAGYFSKVVVCLLLRKTTTLVNYIRAYPNIIKRLVDLIGITSIMEVLIRLSCADEHIYANHADTMQWLEEINILEMIVDKFSSSDCPEVHANASETLCAITRYASPGLASKISSPGFIGSLFSHALEESRPKSVLVNLLTVCISLLDPKRLTSGVYYMYARQTNFGSGSAANTETVQGMLERLGDLLKLLEISSDEHPLITTYGKLQPPMGKHRLKIVDFISVLLAVGNDVVEKKLIHLGALKRILDLFFEYPFNNFLHHYVEHIILSSLESKNPLFVEHILCDCNLVERILEAEKNSTLAVELNKPTVPVEGRVPPRIGNIGHLTRIANKLVHLANSNSDIQKFLQENSDWVDWHTNVLVKRNAVGNVFQWACGRPTTLQDRARDSDDDDYQDRDYDVAALANNLSQAFRYGIYNNDATPEAHVSNEREEEDEYFDDESAEVVISSLRLGDDQESGSLFTNSNWFEFEDARIADEHAPVSVSPNTEGLEVVDRAQDKFTIEENEEDLDDTATSIPTEPKPGDNNETGVSDKPHERIESKASSDDPTEVSPASSLTPELREEELDKSNELGKDDQVSSAVSTTSVPKTDDTGTSAGSDDDSIKNPKSAEKNE